MRPPPHDQQRTGIVRGQKTGPQRSGRRRAPGGDHIAVERCQRHAGGGVEQDVGRMQARQAQGRIAVEDVDDLQAVITLIAPGRHEQRRAAGLTAGDGMRMAQGHGGLAGKGIGQTIDQPGKAERGLGLFSVEMPHGDRAMNDGVGRHSTTERALPLSRVQSRRAGLHLGA